MNTLTRWLTHLWLDASDVRRALPDAACARLEDAVRQSEARHLGELRLCVEAGLDAARLWRSQTPRQRAIELFSQLRVWDTAQNNGVLVYLLLAEHRIEIVADRGLSERVAPQTWQHLADRLGEALAAGRTEAGLSQAIAEVGELLQRHFPDASEQGKRNGNRNELPDAIVLL
ncbi:MAG: TPM domain-containing protein [Burkholderiales bacterium]|nr:TPM domain-containing protein [Burkholderiales bacterium]